LIHAKPTRVPGRPIISKEIRMKEVPKKEQDEVGGGTIYQPWCPPPPLDNPSGYPQFPGCPTDPPISDPTYTDPVNA